MKPNGQFGRPHGLLQTDREKLGLAEKRIGELERDRIKLINQCAWLRVGVEALGRHFDLSPVAAKQIVDDFVQKKEVELAEQMKTEFKQQLEKGSVNFNVVDRTQEPPPQAGD